MKTIGEEVSFKLGGEIIDGVVAIVDKHGTFENPDEVSYDIFANGTLYKHVTEHLLINP